MLIRLLRAPLFAYKVIQRHARMSSQCDDVIFESVKDRGLITLNRPEALNALNLSMVSKLYATLKQWEQEKSCVVIKGAGNRAFCSGGDLKDALKVGINTCDLHRTEYLTDYLIGSYKAPYIALMDGIVMGGGVGISVHGRYRVVTERTLFAMPETAIGFYPDVGTTYFLPRLNGKLGYFLALTGHRLKGFDVLAAGIGTHYCETFKLHELEDALLNRSNSSEDDIEQVLKKYCTYPKGEFTLTPYLGKINKCFAQSTVEYIVEELEKDGSDWAQSVLRTLAKLSPTSLKIALKAHNLGINLSLRECLQMENRLTTRCLAHKNFSEGVKAILFDKNHKPTWSPSTLAAVTDQIVDRYFDELPESQELHIEQEKKSFANIQAH